MCEKGISKDLGVSGAGLCTLHAHRHSHIARMRQRATVCRATVRVSAVHFQVCAHVCYQQELGENGESIIRLNAERRTCVLYPEPALPMGCKLTFETR